MTLESPERGGDIEATDKTSQGSTVESLDDRIRVLRTSVANLVTDTESLGQTYADLSNLLFDRHTERGLASDIYESLEWARKALSLSSSDDPKLPIRKSDVATCLESTHRLDGNAAFLNESIILQEEAIDLLLKRGTPPEDTLLQECRYNVCVALVDRFQTTGNEDDLRRAIVVNHEVIDSSGGVTRANPDVVHQLGSAYYDSFDLSGDIADLERSLEMLDQALITASTEPYKDEWSFRHRRVQAAIARCLHRMYTATGDSSHLTSCIQRMRDAMVMTPSDSVLWVDYQSWLGAFLFDMYRHTQDQEYLVEAIGLERACLSSTPQDHPLLAWRLSNLGQSLGLQYEVNDDSSDLDNMAEESIDFQKRAIEHDANAATMTAWWKYRLSETLLLKYMRKGDKGCLKEALGYATDAADAYSTGHPEYTLVQMTRALILAEMGAEVGVVLGTFRLGLQRSSTVPHMIMECALALAKFAVSKQMYKDALEGYCMALDLMPEVLWFGLEMNDRTVRMSKFNLASIAADAAACSLSIGNPELAIELLEQGRSLLWSQAFSLDTDVSVLDRENPAMALKFRKLSTQLRQAWSSKSEVESHGDGGGDHGHRLFSEWHRIVDEIRSLPGFDRFLRPLPFSVLRESAQEGPVIILNASPIRMDAIILSMAGPAVHVVSLPCVPFSELEVVASDAHRGRMRGRPALRGCARGSDGDPGNESNVEPVNWIWDHVVRWIVDPIKQAIEESNVKSERIWLCPTGLFTFLPLHAASPSDSTLPGLYDMFFISYTPTLTSLIRARQARRFIQDSDNTIRVLAIAQSVSTLEGFQVLQETSAELLAIAKHVVPSRLTRLEDSQATVSRVSSEMPFHHFVHFACHAHQDEEPMESSLHMHDGLLKMGDLVKMQPELKRAEFAFLSCCETATGAKKMPDEAVHLAAALQYTGFQSIISTLWSIDDWTAPRVADAVYRELLSNDKLEASRGAVALGKAIRRLKKRKGMAERLVPYVHIGA